MPWWAILLIALAAFFTILLFLPVRLCLRYEEERLSVFLRVLGLPFALYPKRKKIVRKKPGEKKKKAKAKKERPKEEKKAADGGIRKYRRTVQLILRILQKSYHKLLACFHVRICEIHAIVATPDAAKTAIAYGVMSQSLAYLLEILDRYVKTDYKVKNVTVTPDFLSEKSRFRVRVVFSSNLWRVLSFAVTAGIAFLQNKQKGSVPPSVPEKSNG